MVISKTPQPFNPVKVQVEFTSELELRSVISFLGALTPLTIQGLAQSGRFPNVDHAPAEAFAEKLHDVLDTAIAYGA